MTATGSRNSSWPPVFGQFPNIGSLEMFLKFYLHYPKVSEVKVKSQLLRWSATFVVSAIPAALPYASSTSRCHKVIHESRTVQKRGPWGTILVVFSYTAWTFPHLPNYHLLPWYNLGLFVWRWRIFFVHAFCDNSKPHSLISVVQFSFGWG